MNQQILAAGYKAIKYFGTTMYYKDADSLVDERKALEDINMKHMLIQLQLSNYDTSGKFILECDSGWNVTLGHLREMLKLNTALCVDILGPERGQLLTQPEDIDGALFSSKKVRYIESHILPFAPATRYDFSFAKTKALGPYDFVYLNDPMQLRNFKAALGTDAKYFSQNHFIDNPSCPKFPEQYSMWLGQCEAAIRADYNFWTCQSALDTFLEDMKLHFLPQVIASVAKKSYVWDAGYSIEEITSPIIMSNVRFSLPSDKPIVFVPNRVGGRGRSSDYTNCGRFVFDILPRVIGDCYLVCGNPSQKFANSELPCLQLVPGTLNRDEYKYVASKAAVVVALYDQDRYGGCASRECIELGCAPLWLDCNEYARLSKEAGYTEGVCTFDTIVDTLSSMLKEKPDTTRLQEVVRQKCSYEYTTKEAMRRMNLCE